MNERSSGGNVIAAVILSVVVLFAWDYFFAPKDTAPIMPTSDVSIPFNDSVNGSANNGVSLPQNSAVSDVQNPVQNGKSLNPNMGFQDITTILKNTQAHRLPINTQSVIGSIDLKTGRFDDLVLKRHDKKLDSDKKVRLLAPSNTEQGFFAEIGYSVSGEAENKSTFWNVVSGDLNAQNQTVTLKKSMGAIDVTRKITLDDNYMFQISDTLTNNSTADIGVTPYGLVKENDPASRNSDSSYVVHTGIVGYVNGGLIEQTFSDIKDENFKDGSIDGSTGGWIGITDKYWAAVLIPDNHEPLKVRGIFNPYANQDGYQADYTLKTRKIGAGQSVVINNKLFSGAKSVTLINQYHDGLKIQGFDFLIDWGWFWFFTRPIFKGLLYIYDLVGNYGVAILLLTLVLKTFFLPLANKSYTAMSKMKKLQPEMEKIKLKNAKDPMAQQQELIALYKREKVNPVAGCWPMLLQIPVFFALYKVLNVALELRHQPFFGWVQDLSAPDPTNIFTLFGLIPLDLPSFLHVGIWPLLMGITMWMQQRLNPAPTDPIQGKLMSFFPIIFTFILAPFSAGLVIYWTWNNILSITQQALIMKRIGVPVEFRLWKNKKDDNSIVEK